MYHPITTNCILLLHLRLTGNTGRFTDIVSSQTDLDWSLMPYLATGRNADLLCLDVLPMVGMVARELFFRQPTCPSISNLRLTTEYYCLLRIHGTA